MFFRLKSLLTIPGLRWNATIFIVFASARLQRFWD
jgi:hypothetical protein